jgi:hypothetical protein
VEIAINSAGEAIIGSGVGVVSKLNSTGSAFVYSNFVFPAVNAAIDTVAGDGAGAVYAAGSFDGPPPSGSSLLQPIQAWGPNGWVAKLDGSGSLVWNTFLGSNGVGFNSRMATDGAGNLYILAVDSIANNEDLGFPGSPGSIDPQQPLPPILAAMLLKIAPSLGSPVPLANPGRVSFPATQVGMSSSPSDVTVGNYGDADLPAPAGVSVTGPFSQTNNCSSTIPGGQKCDINVIYSPTSASGPQTGILTVNFGGTPASQSVALSGTAIIAGFSPAPNPVAFPAQAVNITSPAQNLVITNNGTAPLLITAMQAAGDFAVTNTSACAPPVSPGGTCTVQVTFTPTALGSRTGTLTVTDNAPGSPHSVSLSGTGVAANLGLTTAGGSSSSAAVPAGGTASYTLSIGGQGMSGNATLSCTGAPAASTCNVPSGVTVSSTTSSTFNVSVSTTPRTSSALHSPGLGKVSGLWAVGLMGMLVLPLAAKRSRSKRFYSLLIGLLALTLLSSCGGGSGGGGGQKGTPSGTYTLTVTANTGTANQSMNLTLTVQ